MSKQKSVWEHKQKNMQTFICCVCGKVKRLNVFDDELPDGWEESVDAEPICPKCVKDEEEA